MSSLFPIRHLSSDARNAFLAAFLGWTLDAFDYFVLVFVLSDVATAFHTGKPVIALSLTLTLAMRPVGALLFGLAADRFGRRVPLMVDVIFYSVIELLSGFAPNLTTFMVLRAIFGIAMGGEWGLGAALAMESVPAETRGMLSGILQEGYAVGYFLAAISFRFIVPAYGWRAMFFVGALPALLSLFIRVRVKESPAWQRQNAAEQPHPGDNASLPTAPTEVLRPGTATGRPDLWNAVRQNLKLFVYMVALMTAFNFMSHGTQDLYPTFLKTQHHFKEATVSTLGITASVGALVGGMVFGSLSQRFGRRRSIIAAVLLGLPIIPLWAFSPTAASLALGGFLMQFMVQGAWGVVPAHLSELAPGALRGTFTGFAYQLGNLIASVNTVLEAWLAEKRGLGYALALAGITCITLLATASITATGREEPEKQMG